MDEKEREVDMNWDGVSDRKGLIVEMENKREDMRLGWGFGGWDGRSGERDIEGEYWKENVLNVEGREVRV